MKHITNVNFIITGKACSSSFRLAMKHTKSEVHNNQKGMSILIEISHETYKKSELHNNSKGMSILIQISHETYTHYMK